MLTNSMTQSYLKQYKEQQSRAKGRNIDWQFTYDEWLQWWGTDIINRGRGSGKLVMARYKDQGPYHPDNVFKHLNEENVRDAQLGMPKSEDAKQHMRKPKTEEHSFNISQAVSKVWTDLEYKKQRSIQTNLKIVEKYKNMTEEEFTIWKQRFEGKTGSALSNLKKAEKIRAN